MTARTESLARVQEAFRTLPDRYLGAPKGRESTVQVRFGDLGRVYEVSCDRHSARVRIGTSTRPDVVINTDSTTWLALRAGEMSGVEAFSDRSLSLRGDLDKALAFESMFRQEDGRPPLMRLRDVRLDGVSVSTLTMGSGTDVVLIHGLGDTKYSFFDAAATLARGGYRVHAIDLPGFGSSSKPLTAPYTAGWQADKIVELLDALDIDSTHLVGNSMGGRVSIDVGLTAPGRVRGLVLLCPAVAFVKRPWARLVRVLRPEFGLLPHAFRRSTVEGQLRQLLADPDAMDPAVQDIAVDEFRRIYSSPAARLAFLSSARNLYLDRPFGSGGYYERLAGLKVPALFVWATHDPLIPASFRHYVEQWLPSAEQVTLNGCGHVPQVERSAETSALIARFLTRVDAGDARPVGAPATRRHAA